MKCPEVEESSKQEKKANTQELVLSDEEDIRDDITGNLISRDRLMRIKDSGKHGAIIFRNG